MRFTILNLSLAMILTSDLLYWSIDLPLNEIGTQDESNPIH